MSEDNPRKSFEVSMDPASAGSANLVYALYLLGLVLGGVPTKVGLVIAYVNKDQAPDWLRSHYLFQIHTFWKGLLFLLICLALMPVGVGFVLLFLLFLWCIVRSVRGLSAVGKRAPIEEFRRWGF
jgi:uncharacterized membrane protein